MRKRALGQRPRIEAKVSRAERPYQRWATDLCRVWGGKEGRQLERISQLSKAKQKMVNEVLDSLLAQAGR